MENLPSHAKKNLHVCKKWLAATRIGPNYYRLTCSSLKLSQPCLAGLYNNYYSNESLV